MKLVSTCTRVAGIALATLLVGCADAPSGLVSLPDTGVRPSLSASVTPLVTRAFVGSDVRALVAVENRGLGPIGGVATLCIGDAGTTDCGPIATRLVLPTLVEGARRVDTASVTLDLAPSPFVDVPQLVALRVCASPSIDGAVASCATSGMIRVLPDFERACGPQPLAIGDSVENVGTPGNCTLSSTGAHSTVYSLAVAAGDTVHFSVDAHGTCGSVAVFGQDGEIIKASAVCGEPATFTLPIPVGGTYHVSVGGSQAGYVLKTSYVATDFVAGSTTEP